MSTLSWIIRNKETKEVVTEIWNEHLISKINQEKYEAVPANEHLASLNEINKYEVGINEVLLVNLETGRTKIVDGYSLYGGYLPDGYVIVENLTVKDWCEAIMKLNK